MNRSRPAVREAIKFIHDGGIGKVYMARGLCFKPRPSSASIPTARWQPGEKYTLTVDGDARSSRPTTPRTSRRSTTTCGSARRRSGRSTATASTTTGTGTGTTATATPATRARTSSTSRAGASASTSTRSRSARSAATSAAESSQETPDMQTTMFKYADGTILEFATRGEHTNDEGSAEDRQPLLRHQGLALDRRRRPQLAVVPRAARTRRGRAPTRRPRRGGSDPLVLDQHRVPALPELRRRDPRRRSEAADLRHRWKATCRRRCRTWRTSPTASAAR